MPSFNDGSPEAHDYRGELDEGYRPFQNSTRVGYSRRISQVHLIRWERLLTVYQDFFAFAVMLVCTNRLVQQSP